MSERQTTPDHIYVGRIPGMWKWSTDYSAMAEWAGGEENVSIMHKRGREYVLDLSTDEAVIENQECCMNRGYDCGHAAYGPPRRLPAACPECHPVATDGGTSTTRVSQSEALEAIDNANQVLSDALKKANQVEEKTPQTHLVFTQIVEAHQILAANHPDWEDPE